ncbi:Polyporopepsin [Psilocybe cubensis]|uniref:Polyporopepsin n=1 Tax=Psilocybe cubensis TaxID=181762 RepID=A0ACB8H372_PSICU|nr:Polyporopepsin [Psilocybe cubensis]KAH9482175.1 Polyporopepsin [Psilocybe cubensis]
MHLTVDLSAAVIFAGAVMASPVLISKSPVTLSLSRRVNTTSIHNLVRHDQSRAKQLRFATARSSSPPDASNFSKQRKDDVNVPADNQAVSYVASLEIGTPSSTSRPNTFSLIVDTGSSNTWFGAGTTKYISGTAEQDYDLVAVQYGSGYFIGDEIHDVVTLAPGFNVSNQSLGKSFLAKGFSDVDGILGLGPTQLTKGTLYPSVNDVIPTIMDNLYNQGLVSNYEVGIFFEATTDTNVSNGQLTFGGTDPSKHMGDITYTPITSISPASAYWGITQSLSYGNLNILSPGTPGIVDTGTTLILIATDAFQKYTSATGATFDGATGLLTITLAQYKNLQNLIFHIEGTDFTLIPDAQIWPRALNQDIGGITGSIYLVIGDLGELSGAGLDFINGLGFLERFYSVFDTGNKRVGLAPTSITTRIINF